jgi:hypothetical protein
MAKKKAGGAKPVQKGGASGKKSSNPLFVGTAVVLVVLVAAVWFVTSGHKTATASIPADEAKYIGRLLPSGYQEPKVAGAQSYSGTVRATQLQAVANGGGVSIPVAQLAADKIVQFDFKRSDGQQLPLIAYVKPSGKAFVGVDYCIPCQGVGQRFENGVLTCNTCGTTRDIETGAGLTGACRLYPLDEVPATVSGGKLTIDASVLNSWQPQPKDRQVGA